MKMTQLSVVVCALSVGLSVSGAVWSATNDVKGIDIIIKKKPNGNAAIHADQVTSTSDTVASRAAASRAVATKGVSGSIAADGDANVTHTNSETVNDSRSDVTADITAEGDVNVTNAATKTINISRSNIKNNMTVNDGTNVVNETRLHSVVSGNMVFADTRSVDGTEGTAVMGNSICTNAFEGTTGITVVNMSNGHNSSIQSPVSIVVTP